MKTAITFASGYGFWCCVSWLWGTVSLHTTSGAVLGSPWVLLAAVCWAVVSYRRVR